MFLLMHVMSCRCWLPESLMGIACFLLFPKETSSQSTKERITLETLSATTKTTALMPTTSDTDWTKTILGKRCSVEPIISDQAVVWKHKRSDRGFGLYINHVTYLFILFELPPPFPIIHYVMRHKYNVFNL